MRYLYLIQNEMEFQGPPPARLMEEMGKLMGKRIADGSLIDTAGLMPVAQAVRATLKRGKLNIMDGPFTESKEIVGGYAIFKFDTREQAIGALTDFMELHRLYADGWEFSCEMREINEHTNPEPVV
ncbi:MAG: YciI family protein [Terricaulis sp.]